MRQVDEALAFAAEKGAVFWKAAAMILRGWLFWHIGKASEVIQTITSAYTAFRSTGATLHIPPSFSYLAHSYAALGNFNDAWQCMNDAMAAVETTNERLFEAEVHRIAGEVALMPSDRNAAKAEEHFERALAVARQQQAKSWELRAAMSIARLWRDQGKLQQARELLAPVYGWFTEGFDTRDLKEAKALLEELA
jgi:predicted ATPase